MVGLTWRPKRQRSERSSLGLHNSKSSCPGSSTSSLPNGKPVNTPTTVRKRRPHPRTHEACERREIDVHSNRRGGTPVVPEQNESPARVRRHGDDRTHPDLLVREFILPPIEALVGGEQDDVSWLLVIYHNENRARVTELPEVRVFMNFFPRKARIPTQKGVTLVVWCKLLAYVPHRHNQSNNGGAAERCAGVESLCVSVHMQ